MKKFLLYFFMISSSVYSQYDYEHGFYIANDGSKVSGYFRDYVNIENNDFFFFKESLEIKEDSKIPISKVIELQIGNNSKFICKTIEYHPNRVLSSEVINKEVIDHDKRVIQRKLLKTLIEGDVNLYVTYIDNISLYYLGISESNSKIVYLESYKYKDNNIKEYSRYKRQLNEFLNCNNDDFKKYIYVKYNESDLKKAVNEYNLCKTGFSKDLTENESSKEKIKVSVFAGGKFFSGKFESTKFYSEIAAESKSSPSFGVEVAYLIPMKNKRTELFLRASYDKYNSVSEELYDISSGTTTVNEKIILSSSFLNINLGPRYYFKNLKSKNNIFVDTSIVFSTIMSGENTYIVNASNGINEKYELNTKSAIAYNLGLGYQFFNNYTIEFRYTTNANYFENTFVESKISNFNINLKYLFF